MIDDRLKVGAMSQYRSNSASFPVFVDGTSSANPSCFEESTTPSGNLASIQKNWILLSSSELQDRTNAAADRKKSA